MSLWTSPEILREKDSNYVGTQKGDIYSFAIICSEILTRKPAWYDYKMELNEEGILF